jgi:DNA-binding NarL/FixJ family response regulator
MISSPEAPLSTYPLAPARMAATTVSSSSTMAALHTVGTGGAVFGRGVAAQVLALTSARPDHDHRATSAPDGTLTERERQVAGRTQAALKARNATRTRSE